MAIAKHLKGTARAEIVEEHREQLYYEAIDKVLEGKAVDPEYIQMRAKKVDEIKKKRKKRRRR